jgi:uncharacterized membrane protein
VTTVETQTEPQVTEAQQTGATEFESYPLTRQEYINAVIHFYRGELSRSTAWRARIDQTTYWAVALGAGMFSFTFASLGQPHFTLLFGNLILVLLLMLESRRYRRYDAWYARVRMIEENFYIPILSRNLVSPMSQWRKHVTDDLMTPRYKITLSEAVGIRLVRNYIWIFLVMLGGWITKLEMLAQVAGPEGRLVFGGWSKLYEAARVGFVPPWAVISSVAIFYGALIAFALAHRKMSADREMRSEMVSDSREAWQQV